MHKSGFLLILLGLLVAGGVYVSWTKRIPFSPRATATEQSPPSDEEKTSTTKTATAKTTNTQTSTIKSASAPVAPIVKATNTEPAAADNTPVNADTKQPAVAIRHDPPPPFPIADKIPAGLRGDSVTGTYGDPALSALTSTGRHVVETFVYARDRGRSATVIRLEDGKVAGSSAQSEPVQASGLSVPPRTFRTEPVLQSAPPI